MTQDLTRRVLSPERTARFAAMVAAEHADAAAETARYQKWQASFTDEEYAEYTEDMYARHGRPTRRRRS